MFSGVLAIPPTSMHSTGGAAASVACTVRMPASPFAYVQPASWRPAPALAWKQLHSSPCRGLGSASAEVASWLLGWAALASEQLCDRDAESSQGPLADWSHAPSARRASTDSATPASTQVAWSPGRHQQASSQLQQRASPAACPGGKRRRSKDGEPAAKRRKAATAASPGRPPCKPDPVHRVAALPTPPLPAVAQSSAVRTLHECGQPSDSPATLAALPPLPEMDLWLGGDQWDDELQELLLGDAIFTEEDEEALCSFLCGESTELDIAL